MYTYILTYILTYVKGPSYVHTRTTDMYKPHTHRLKICAGCGSFLVLSCAFNRYIRNNPASFGIVASLYLLRSKARCLLCLPPVLNLTKTGSIRIMEH